MSDTDSFIDEVTEEVRRDRLFRLMRRYGWIAVLAVLVLVAGAGWNEWRKSQERQAAQALGDAILSGLERDAPSARARALAEVEAPNPGSRAVLDMLTASEEAAVAPADAANRLLALADSSGVAPAYRQIAILKAVMIPDSGLPVEERRQRLEELALGSGLIRLLAEEQLGLMDAAAGETSAAIERLRQVSVDADATQGLRRRVTQVIVALGGDPRAQ